MNKTGINKFIKNAQRVIVKHSPEILTGIGIAGMVTSTVLAVKATPKALSLIEEERECREIDIKNGIEEGVLPVDISPKDMVKLCWKCYIPAAITGVVSAACIIGASAVNNKRNAVLATAYTLSETALTEYREKVVEQIGEEKEREVRDSIARDKVAKHPVSPNEVIFTGKGKTLFYETLFGRYFEFDIDKLKKIENELNRRMRSEMHISLNEFYYEVGLDEVEAGHDIGWDIDNGYIEIEFSPTMLEKPINGYETCIAISFRTPPRWGFDK